MIKQTARHAPATTTKMPVSAPGGGHTHGQRRDIQGLRALAVGLVVIYHLWPGRVPGGYVGVDVFFVISGYLITGNLLRHPPASLRQLAGFWGRRVRRLLPAATLVLGVTLVASVLWLPATTRAQVSKEVIASSLYVENWALTAQATDYLAADELHTPVQHYWSLSVEEQFYIIWPLLILAAAWLASRHTRLPWIGLMIVAVFAGSLAFSVIYTASSPAAAYFVTPTRMWELAAGGIAALVTHHRPRPGPAVAAAASWSGIGLCLIAGFMLDASTPFPGIAAIVPVAGSFLVLVANADNARRSADRLWRLRLLQMIGDASYSIYLWHWPIIVILPFVLGHDLTWPEKLALIVVVFGVSLASKRFVEDPVRRSHRLSASLPRTFAVGLACMSLIVALGLAVWLPAKAAQANKPTVSAANLTDPDTCYGAGAWRNDCAPSATGLLTTPDFAAVDKSDVYRPECWIERPFPSTDRPICHFGPATATTRIALVGNSHAGHWQPAVAAAAEANGWRLDTYLASTCFVADVDLQFNGKGESAGCRAWSNWAAKTIAAGKYDLIIASSQTSSGVVGVPKSERDAAAEVGYASVLKRWTDSGTPVLVIRDNPVPATNGPECVALNQNHLSKCDTPEKRAVKPDPLADAAKADGSPLVRVADFTDMFCRNGTCPTVIGDVIVYRDRSHITSTYSRTLTPEVSAAIRNALDK